MSIDIGEFEEIIELHMKNQPYSIVCADCGKRINCKSTVDNDLDLLLDVSPCNHCEESK